MDQEMAPSHPYKVLIVDDERLIADTLAKLFESAGYLSRAAYSAEAVLESAATWSPHLAVLDVIPPGMSGLELARWLQGTCPECHLVLLSGQSATNDLLEAERAPHAWTALPKPIPPGELLDLASALLQ